jgi:hypothetical protein
MNLGAIALFGLALFVALILLEGHRQGKRYGRGGGHGANLARAGMLELQRQLEPERKVEQILEPREAVEANAQGDPPSR